MSLENQKVTPPITGGQIETSSMALLPHHLIPKEVCAADSTTTTIKVTNNFYTATPTPMTTDTAELLESAWTLDPRNLSYATDLNEIAYDTTDLTTSTELQEEPQTISFPDLSVSGYETVQVHQECVEIPGEDPFTPTLDLGAVSTIQTPIIQIIKEEDITKNIDRQIQGNQVIREISLPVVHTNVDAVWGAKDMKEFETTAPSVVYVTVDPMELEGKILAAEKVISSSREVSPKGKKLMRKKPKNLRLKIPTKKEPIPGKTVVEEEKETLAVQVQDTRNTLAVQVPDTPNTLADQGPDTAAVEKMLQGQDFDLLGFVNDPAAPADDPDFLNILGINSPNVNNDDLLKFFDQCQQPEIKEEPQVLIPQKQFTIVPVKEEIEDIADPDYTPYTSGQQRVSKRPRGRPPVPRTRLVEPRKTNKRPAASTVAYDHAYDLNNPQPSTSRGLNRKNVSSNGEKEAKYRRMRDLNNEASKRCRKNRKRKNEEMGLEEERLRARNAELKAQARHLEDLVGRLKRQFIRKVTNPMAGGQSKRPRLEQQQQQPSNTTIDLAALIKAYDI